ncbi:MAG: DNA double-strand break repair nuclease NurA [Hormoscilla sp.]
MPLKQSQVLSLLQARRSDFKRFDQNAAILQQYRKAWAAAASDFAGHARSGDFSGTALAAVPLEKVASQVIPFDISLTSQEERLAWARPRLTGVTTFAVDGSQIYPSKDFSIPIALIQVGWYENLHLPTGAYQKDVAVDILTPAQLQTSGASSQALERIVNRRRFEMEIRRLIRYMQEHRTDGSRTLVFYDGSLIASFAETQDPESREFYVQNLRQLLQTSERCRVPLVGYIDTTTARDLTETLRQLFALPEMPGLHDAQLLHPQMQRGSRTGLWRCQRPGILKEYGSWADKIAFCYLKTNDGYPARLEMPIWIYEDRKDSLLERAIEWVMCEVIVGGGYPYAIETADQVAVLQANDRLCFYRLLQNWADKEHLHLRLSRKMVSKVCRRL